MAKISQEEFERLLAGKPSPDNGLEDIESFVQRLKATHVSPVNPTVQAAHLSAIMKAVRTLAPDGHFPAPAGPEAGAHTSPSGIFRWKRVVLKNAAAALVLKIVGGAAALAASAGGLAALEALPEPAQRPVATAVEAVTPFNLPGNEQEQTTGDNDEGNLQVHEVPSEPAPAAEPNPNASLGQSVAEDAKDGGVEGAEVSERAREEARERREERQVPGPANVHPHGSGQVPGPPPGAGPPAAEDVPGAGPQNGGNRTGQAPAGQSIPQNNPPGPPPGVPAGR